MKTITEIRDMIQNSSDYSRNATLFEICAALLDQIDALRTSSINNPELYRRLNVLEARTEVKPHIPPKCLAVQDGVDYAIAERCCSLDMGHGGDHSWQSVDFTQPHAFVFAKQQPGYKVCKCGFSEFSTLHT